MFLEVPVTTRLHRVYGISETFMHYDGQKLFGQESILQKLCKIFLYPDVSLILNLLRLITLKMLQQKLPFGKRLANASLRQS